MTTDMEKEPTGYVSGKTNTENYTQVTGMRIKRMEMEYIFTKTAAVTTGK